MSVMIRENQTGKFFILAKGSPEMIHNFSTFKFANFNDFVKKLSFGGFRSIGFGYK